ncbi:substance-P receptor-like [Anneissia japonica]|uniref:substance-P receptor-like n=1 Tax=Anneissia japonica TaxID=1529436 RepID=UPI001425596B|nr:substance-P receptor-like [Anneissia japonica]
MSSCDNLNDTLDKTSDAVELGLSISRYVLTIIGVVANLMVIIVFINCKIYRKCFTYLLLFQQASIDLFGCCFYLILFNYRVPDGEYGIVYCKSRTLFWMFASASTFNLVFISIERYIAVLHPLKYWMRGKVRTKMVPKLCVPWLFAILVVFQLAILSVPDKLSPGKCRYCYSSGTVRIISGGSIFLLNWIIPIFVMTFCYRRVYITMQNPTINLHKSSSSVQIDRTDETTDDTETKDNVFTVEGSQKQYYSKTQKNFIVTMVITTIVFAVSISPLLIVYLVYVLCDCFDYDRHPFRQAAIICFVSSLAANPFVYAFKFNEFKIGFEKTFIRRRH